MDMERSQCRCCGGALDPRKAENSVLRCEFCGAIWTIARKESDPAALTFLRMGEHDLDVCRFEDAYTAFAKAAELDPKEPEAFFGMALAANRVQYIRDLVNERLQPICHEIQKKFSEDGNYLRALALATKEQRAAYEDRAREIDYIREQFLRLKSAGREYDCFLCVKVSDGADGYTRESVNATRLYHALKKDGYHPFYSEEEARQVTGGDYEALILYALNTSSAMLLICNGEHANHLRTPWVKNEYTRYLSLIAAEEKEQDSLAIVFEGTPLERLPERPKKLQGIKFDSYDALERIKEFVDRCKGARQGGRAEREAKEKAEREAKERAEREAKVKTAQKASPASDFQIEGTVLKKYVGKGGNVVIPEGITEIGKEAFLACTSLSNVIIPKSVIKIGDSAFRGCTGLKSVVIPDSVTLIGEYAFVDCKELTSVTIPASVTKIGEHAFDGCNRAKDVNISDIAAWCKIIFMNEGSNPMHNGGGNLYLNGELITRVVIPDGTKYIGQYSFSGCRGLTSVVIPDSVTSIGMAAFRGCGLTSIIIPAGVTSIDRFAFEYCGDLTSIIVSSGNTSYYGRDNCLIERASGTLILGCKNSVIPNSVTKIGNEAFSGCKGLTSALLPNGVKEIGVSAFSDCTGLKEIKLPEYMDSIGGYAFRGCTGLKKIRIGHVKHIFPHAFEGCKKLTIYCVEQRHEWYSGWNSSNCRVKWGVKWRR